MVRVVILLLGKAILFRLTLNYAATQQGLALNHFWFTIELLSVEKWFNLELVWPEYGLTLNYFPSGKLVPRSLFTTHVVVL